MSRRVAVGIVALVAGTAVVSGDLWRGVRAQAIDVDAHVIATNIPGASAISQVGTFLNVPPPGACANPIPSRFPSFIQPGAVLDPKRSETADHPRLAEKGRGRDGLIGSIA
jgi:hypothetical protein